MGLKRGINAAAAVICSVFGFLLVFSLEKRLCFCVFTRRSSASGSTPRWSRADSTGRRDRAASAPQSPLRILSDAPKFRAECLQTLRDGEVEEESAAPPSIYAAIATPLVHDFIAAAAGGRSGRARTVSSALFRRTSCRFGRRVFVAARLLCRSDRSDGGQARRGVGRAASS